MCAITLPFTFLLRYYYTRRSPSHALQNYPASLFWGILDFFINAASSVLIGFDDYHRRGHGEEASEEDSEGIHDDVVDIRSSRQEDLRDLDNSGKRESEEQAMPHGAGERYPMEETDRNKKQDISEDVHDEVIVSSALVIVEKSPDRLERNKVIILRRIGNRESEAREFSLRSQRLRENGDYENAERKKRELVTDV